MAKREPSTIYTLILLFVSLLSVNFRSDASGYSHHSVLSSGKWVKIEVPRTGMHFIPGDDLKKYGFGDLSKVNVYGYGGGMLSENLDSPDDLPLVPSIAVGDGLIFFGSGPVKWRLSDNGETTYCHIGDPYSDHAYYFLSDRETERKEPGRINLTGVQEGDVIDLFVERMVHETDLVSAMKSGRLMLGEDFRANASRNLKFELPGNSGDVIISTAFGSKTSSGVSSLVFSANGLTLGATTADLLPASDSKLITTTLSVKKVENPGENLDLNIKFNGSGTVSMAALDYIELEYPRKIELHEGMLYFYVNPGIAGLVEIGNATERTMVWDVTDPLNPVIVDCDYENGLIKLPVKEGYREFVAFEPESVENDIIFCGGIENQDLHGLEAPDMLVISPAEYMSAAERFEELHAGTDGLRIVTVTPETVYNEFSSGKPDVTAFRKLLKMWFDRAGGVAGSYPNYCLIMSRPTYDNKMVTAVVKNAGYPRIPIWQSPDGESLTTSYSTDDYIGMLEDVSGEFNIANAKINVAVGRMPVKSLQEANYAIDKLEGYMKSEDWGNWRNSVMVIADDGDSGIHLTQAENCIEEMKKGTKGSDMLYEKLYLDSYPLEYTATGKAYPQASARLLSKINEGVLFIDYIGHANNREWGHEHLLTWTDIGKLENKRLPFIYAATCEFMNWDSDEISGAEALWLNPSGGVIGMLCPSREVLIASNGELNRATSSHFFENDREGKPLSVGEMMLAGKNGSNTGSNKLRYGLIGDPSLRLRRPVNSVKIDSLGLEAIDDKESFPVFNAGSTIEVTGHIDNAAAKLLEGYDGVLEISLYAGEKVVTTLGNGDDGEEMVYNDREVCLFKGKTEVKNGRWNTKLLIPADVDDNFSPALLSFYSHSNEGVEANGSFEKFYVYGVTDTVPDDHEGPEIIEIYLNNPGFKTGGEVTENPVLYVKMRDDSGINISGSGIGHDMVLAIDDKLFFTDLEAYYEPDLMDVTSGTLTYEITGITAGRHNLKFTVWDNAGNSTTEELEFSISALREPAITVLATDVSPATNEVTFIIETDGGSRLADCRIEVFDMAGRRVWSAPVERVTTGTKRMNLSWNLNDYGGRRIPRGIYPYRATVVTETGERMRRSSKLAVTPP